MILKFLFGLFGGLLLLKLYFGHSRKKCVNNVSLLGKTAVVTGSNTGIGLRAALELAKRGARVLLACRDQERAELARAEIVKLTGNDSVIIKLVDFSSLASVEKCAKDIQENEPKIDILVNNAGVGGLIDKYTEDGLNICMQVNYFGPTLFTFLLLDLLKKSSNSRIINVASLLAKMGNFSVKTINQYAGRYGTYANSKLCNIFFTVKLARELKDARISVFSLHPGAVKTDIFRRLKGWRRALLDLVAYFTFKSPEEGAQTVIYLATEPNLENLSGRHFDDCEAVAAYASAEDPQLIEDVWSETCKLLKIDPKKYI
ncbi:dehydrogenase/reductase SDR family member 13 [Dendroctonus ponderosae]|uniref:dehydrogenase/reductase SDR family member 13 n=1 Tax=Dendroctonus ponderosae TaxID=77166 RepID=UPI002035B3CE|nr:dehydrogenase/reductase SDR family member 13 [Dendroctonus ponderosae]KAH1012265.1 hypothetical protein HUJ05_011448 [Dendroctonus ponderosae]